MSTALSRTLDPAAIRAIAAACAAADGTDPIDEYGYLVLNNHPERVLATHSAQGFALAYDGQVALAVAPEHRREGQGRAALADLLEQVGEVSLEAWNHGVHPAAARLAAEFGFEPVRELWVLRRPVAGPEAVPLPPMPTVPWKVRGFEATDTDALLAINAAAFAEHPEQGAMDAANLAERMAQDWFDPADLLVADDHGTLLGFHWTKRHSATDGEVYVVGVSPQAQGLGVGKALTLAGLHHLAGIGITDVHLYVESDNAPALAVYTKLGFTHAPADTHTMYRRTVD